MTSRATTPSRLAPVKPSRPVRTGASFRSDPGAVSTRARRDSLRPADGLRVAGEPHREAVGRERKEWLSGHAGTR